MDTGTQANPASPSSSKAIFQHVVTPVGELEQDPISFPFPKHTETRVFENLSSLVDPHNERSDGLYFVSGEAPGVEETNEGGAETNIVLIHSVGGHALRSWRPGETGFGRSDKDVRDKDGILKTFWPKDLAAEIPHSRLWSFGWNAAYDDSTPLTTAANNLVNELSDRDRQFYDNTRLPKLIFIAAGFGGIIAKELLIRCLVNPSTDHDKAIGESCIGIVFLATRHATVQTDLCSPGLQRSMRIANYVFPDHIRSAGYPNLPNLKSNTESINRQFLKFFSRMPPTLCVVNLYRIRPRQLNPTRANAELPSPRKEFDLVYPMNNKTHNWVRLVERDRGPEKQVYQRIASSLRSWTTAPPKTKKSLAAPTTVGANLLSIDGGGVRGLSSLLILQQVMRRIELIEREWDPASKGRARLPVDYFDLAGGTSTGGLVCIMLFRLRMDVQGAIEQYVQLSPKIFHQGFGHYMGTNILRSIVGWPWFDGKMLKDGVRDIVKLRLPEDEKDRLGDDASEALLYLDLDKTVAVESGTPRQGKMFVCVYRKGNDSSLRLRTYPHPRVELAQCKIWEAARATSAAPFYFPTAVIQGEKFWDGGLANNNPAKEVLTESQSLFPRAAINCFISLGTGFSERKPRHSFVPVLGKGRKILKNVTNTERVHATVEEDLAHRHPGSYFRFNASTANDEIGLADYKLLGKLEEYTKDYLGRENVQAMIEQCAQRLARRSSSAIQDRPALPHSGSSRKSVQFSGDNISAVGVSSAAESSSVGSGAR